MLSTVFFAGCATSQFVAPAVHAAAPSSTGGFSRCFLGGVGYFPQKQLEQGAVPAGTPVPKGWTPVGGAAAQGPYNQSMYALFCK